MGMDNATYLFQTYILLWDPQSNNYQNCPLIKVFLFIWAWSPSRTCWDTIGIFKGLNPWKYKKREPKKDWRSISLNRNINLWVNQKRKWSLSYCSFDSWSLILDPSSTLDIIWSSALVQCTLGLVRMLQCLRAYIFLNFWFEHIILCKIL